ncbi:hypothetical protein [Lentisalinibacter sediminis]|uniref:hypothetical protein n=1 Tax=Lentisalinibacter sediminis TaxID=2992237 RepID=UPI0038676279
MTVSRRIAVGFLAQGIGVVGQLIFAWVAVTHHQPENAKSTVEAIVLASIFSTISRLGIDNFFISRFRHRRLFSTLLALFYGVALAVAISGVLLVVAVAFASVLHDATKFFAIAPLTVALSINTVSTNFLIVRDRAPIALLLRGNVVFFTAAILLLLNAGSTWIIWLCTLSALIPGAVILLSGYADARSIRRIASARYFLRWTRAYIYAGRGGILFGILSNVWANWIYILANLEFLRVEELLANLMQRVINGFGVIARMFFAVDPYALKQGAVYAGLVSISLLSLVLPIFLPLPGGATSVMVLVGIVLGLFQLARVRLYEARRYQVLSLQVFALLLSTLWLARDSQTLLVAVGAGALIGVSIDLVTHEPSVYGRLLHKRSGR